MDYLLVTLLIIGTLALTSSSPPAPPPPIIYIQPAPLASTSNSSGCLPWLIGFLVLLVVIGGIGF